jgi:transcriptional regulator with XRE-family HTH domain
VRPINAGTHSSCCSPAQTRIPALPFCHAYLKGPRPLPSSYPQVLATIGDHLRKRRLDLGLLQREVAERLGTDPCTITSWELNRTTPALRFLPGIVRFLGYAPWNAGASIGECLLALRRERGLSQAAFARLVGVDPGLLSRWERNLRMPTGRYARLAEAFIGAAIHRCAGWRRKSSPISSRRSR